MRTIKTLLALVIMAVVAPGAFSRPPASWKNQPLTNPTGEVSYRNNCNQATQQTDMDINNVRARLLNGGDLWWDLSNGRYIVPKVDPKSGEKEVSSLFAGAVWLGGVDPGGNLKVAAQTYRQGASNDFWPGPLNPVDGTTTEQDCKRWDKFFRVLGSNIRQHIRNSQNYKAQGRDYPADEIPRDVKGWPARGNKFFSEVHGFTLPNTNQGLALFYDNNKNNEYDPEDGDYPVIDIRGCDPIQYPDEMVFWIYNDAGNTHGNSKGKPINMEVQVQSFAYATQDELNDMTFYRFKLINRASEYIDSMFFAMWVDADLGCSEDDYIGCDTIFVKNDTCELSDGSTRIVPRRRDLMVVYNADAVDGVSGTTCVVNGTSVPTYGNNVPLLGVDYFRGPLDEEGCELGMSRFMYWDRSNPNQFMVDPSSAEGFYNYLNSVWLDGTPLTVGGNGYNLGSTNITKFAFSSPPNDLSGTSWSMCTANLPRLDRRTLQASGPFRLNPGAVNELIIGVPWVPDITYPCPDLEPLLYADRLAQGLFDNCFDLLDGPTAPDLDWIEMDKELVCILSNDLISNNYKEQYAELDILSPLNLPADERNYKFEGYKIYQLRSPNVTTSQLDDPDNARIVKQIDVKNGISKIFNWIPRDNPFSADPTFVPEEMVAGPDQGIEHTFKITDDQFGSGGGRQLINHKKYYYTVIAYGHNNWLNFDPVADYGQKVPYLEGRLNIQTYTVIPRPIVDRELQAKYGDGPTITRIEGQGIGGIAVELAEGEAMRALDPAFNGELTYQEGKGPIQVKIYDPLNVVDGEFELTIIDDTPADTIMDKNARWVLTNLTTGKIVESERSIERLNEQLIVEHGFSISIAQTPDAGDLGEGLNGAISQTIEFKDPNSPWLIGLPDDGTPIGIGIPIFDWIPTEKGEKNYEKDKNLGLTKFGTGYFAPYVLSWGLSNGDVLDFRLTPRWFPDNNSYSLAQDNKMFLKDLNNVDIYLTSDKSKWSRCVVIETAAVPLTAATNGGLDLPTESAPGYRRKSFDTRYGLSVDVNGQPDGAKETWGGTEKEVRGMGYFPGYAIDVETGERLNIFFGENSIFDGVPDAGQNVVEPGNGRDMLFNPTSELFLPANIQNQYIVSAGCHHFVYVTRQKYDGCAQYQELFNPDRYSGPAKATKKIPLVQQITWCGMFLSTPGTTYKSAADGLIPNGNDVKMSIRVDNPYSFKRGQPGSLGYPKYRFKIDGKTAQALDAVSIENTLDSIKMVPNPYYGYSNYETSEFNNVIKISNLPAKCTVNIYSLDGKFIRRYDRDEVPQSWQGRSNPPIPYRQYLPDIEWDMKNAKGIPVASGVYLIHVNAPGLGERTLKWFGIGREFDPSGL